MDTPKNELRQRLREMLSIPERDRTDAQWDEIIELEIRLAPGNTIDSNRSNDPMSGSGGNTGQNFRPRQQQNKPPQGQQRKQQGRRPNRGNPQRSGGGGNTGGGSGGGNAGGNTGGGNAGGSGGGNPPPSAE